MNVGSCLPQVWGLMWGDLQAKSLPQMGGDGKEKVTTLYPSPEWKPSGPIRGRMLIYQ